MNELNSFSQHGRKGIAYDWQSLCDVETLLSLSMLESVVHIGEFERERELAAAFSK